MAFFILALGAVGHMVLWVALINRVHALGIARRWVNLMTLVFLFMLAFVPVAVAAALVVQAENGSFALRLASMFAWGYAGLCAAFCVGSALQRWYWARHPELATALLTNHTSQLDLRDRFEAMIARGVPTWLGRVPGNQVLCVHVQEKEISIPRLPAAHDGLRIAHLTDLHMCGRLTRAFFEQVVEALNNANPDLVAITGDIVEGDQFLDWLPSTLGELRSCHGVFYVLGNHDRRATEARLKAVLADCGLIHLGDNWRRISVNGMPLILAGNELPWYKPAADLSGCIGGSEQAWPARVLLAHSPDQFKWARENDIDLMLAGHLHGGQVRLPIIGAVTSPSAHGVRYAAGVFCSGNTVMHVSRGVGGLTPFRFNCPPEIAVLVLRAGT
jgi:uncharacterized protein